MTTTVQLEHQPDMELLVDPSEQLYLDIATRLDEFCEEGRYQELQKLGVERAELAYVGSQHGHTIMEVDQTSHRYNSSYKIHGAANAILVALQKHELDHVYEENPPALIVDCASAGNHAEAVAAVCNQLGLVANVDAASSASKEKIGVTEGLGANVDATHPDLATALVVAKSRGSQPGHVFIAPFNDKDVLTGQAILGVQLYEDLIAQGIKGKVVVEAAVGGGGHLTGLLVGYRYAAERFGDTVPFEVEFHGVQMAGGDVANRAVANYRAGLLHSKVAELFPDGTYDDTNDGTFAVPGDLTLPVLADTSKVHSINTVTKAQVGRAMQALTRRHSKLVEPAGALSRAGAEAWARNNATTHLAGDGVTLVTYMTGANVSSEHYKHFMDAVDSDQLQVERQREDELQAYRDHLRTLGRAANQFAYSGPRGLASGITHEYADARYAS